MFKLSICKMLESNGNIQIFGRAFNTGNKELLEYSCSQTKHGYTVDECFERVWFEMGMMSNFFNIPMTKIEFHGTTDDEESKCRECLSISRVSEVMEYPGWNSTEFIDFVGFDNIEMEQRDGCGVIGTFIKTAKGTHLLKTGSKVAKLHGVLTVE